MTPKKLISLRISKATEDKLQWLTQRHGTQTEAIAVAVDRLYESDYNKERPMDNPVYSPTYREHSFSRSELWDMFCGGADIFAETADIDLETLAAQITELRPAMTDTDFRMTDAEIAEAIREYAREHMATVAQAAADLDPWDSWQAELIADVLKSDPGFILKARVIRARQDDHGYPDNLVEIETDAGDTLRGWKRNDAPIEDIDWEHPNVDGWPEKLTTR